MATPLNHILFLDIETVSQYTVYEEMPERIQVLWNKKADQLKLFSQNENLSAIELYERAGIYAEFGKIICISIAHCLNEEPRVISFSGDEKKLLTELANLLNKHFSDPKYILCAHNGKEFDFPYIARRMIVNEIKLPKILNIQGKKPWEIPHLDTLDLWKFGDYKHYTSIDLLAAIFDIPSPKSEMDGSKVYATYWQQNNLQKIIDYCEQDVKTLVEVYKRMMQTAL